MLKTEALLKERFKKKWLESNHATIELYKPKHKEFESVGNPIIQKTYAAAEGVPGGVPVGMPGGFPWGGFTGAGFPGGGASGGGSHGAPNAEEVD